MLQIENIFLAGTIVRAHGFKGELKIVFTPGYNPVKEPQGTVFLMINKKAVPYFIEYVSLLSETYFIVKLEDISTVKQAEKLNRLDVYFPDDLKGIDRKEEFQPAFLQGFIVIDQHGKTVGSVAAILENPAHYLLELHNEVLLPFHEDLIIEIKAEKKIIRLEIAEGLL